VKIATDMLGAGMVTDTDVLMAKHKDLEMEAMLIDARNNREVGLSYLRFLTGDSGIDGVEDFKTLAVDERPLSVWKEEGVSQREDLKAMEHNERTAQAAVGMERSGYWPTIGAMAKYGVSDESVSLDQEKDYYMVAVGVKWNLFDGGGTSSRTEHAKLMQKQAQLGGQYMKEGVMLEVEKNYRNLMTRRAVIEQKAKAKELAESVLVKAKLMYRNGLINMTELLIKEADALRARAELIKARFDEGMSAAEFYLAVGKRLGGDK